VRSGLPANQQGRCRARQGEKSRRARAARMLRRLICAASRSAEPSGNVVRSFVMCASSAQSSIRVRRISSISVSTRIVSSILFRPRQSRPSGGGPCTGGGGCIACDRNEEEECVPVRRTPDLIRGKAEALAPTSRGTVLPGRQEGRVWCGWDGGSGCWWLIRVTPPLRCFAVMQRIDHIQVMPSGSRSKSAYDNGREKSDCKCRRVRLRRNRLYERGKAALTEPRRSRKRDAGSRPFG
jgi:hypothetical protein